ncbi:hypothetical protein ACOME3_005606 [Neoechinorhynchus agilis]
MSDLPKIILDIGSSHIKAGFSTEDEPSVEFPTVTAFDESQQKWLIGFDALRSDADLLHPVQAGVIRNSDHLEKILRYIFQNHLNVDNDRCDVTIAEPIFSNEEDREQIVSIINKCDVNVDTYRFLSQPGCAAASSGLLNTLVVDFGDRCTQVTPIISGNPSLNLAYFFPIGGYHITAYIKDLLSQSGEYFLHQEVDEMKQSYDLQKFLDQVDNFDLNGIQDILGESIVLSREAYFEPNIVGKYLPGLHEVCYNVIESCPSDVKDELYSTIFIVGGGSSLNGISRMLIEMMQQLAGDTWIGAISSSYPVVATWRGARYL